jgi:hypothetical protein
MKIFRIFICLVIIICAQNTQAISNYKLGDTLFVWAKSGLNMRVSPAANASVIEKLQYGKQVIIADHDIGKTSFSVKVFNEYDFVLKGFWVKVNVGDKSGYVFDSYLSRLTPLKITESNGVKRYESELEYLERVFEVQQVLSETPSDYSENPDERPLIPKVWESIYGVSFKKYDSGSSTKYEIEIPVLSFEEGYGLANMFYDFENINKETVEYNNLKKLVITSKHKDMQFSLSSTSYYTIEEKDNRLTISFLTQF